MDKLTICRIARDEIPAGFQWEFADDLVPTNVSSGFLLIRRVVVGDDNWKSGPKSTVVRFFVTETRVDVATRIQQAIGVLSKPSE
jgi:hypothetical protein